MTSSYSTPSQFWPVAMTVAGSDSGGGAGIQADLKTFQALGCYGVSALTAVTCQNTLGVRSVQGLDPSLVQCQMEAILEDFPVKAMKTGMLHSSGIIEKLLDLVPLFKERGIPVVVDPVMVSTSGHPLLSEEGVSKLRQLLGSVRLVTPNRPEAEVLVGGSIETMARMREAVVTLHETSGAAVLLKGGHRPGEMEERGEVVDLLYDGESLEELRFAYRETRSSHGTGCTLSAAVTAYLALGESLVSAVKRARRYLEGAMVHAPGYGSGKGPLHHGWMQGPSHETQEERGSD